MHLLAQCIRSCAPDIITLQEVTRDHWQVLSREPIIADNYCLISDIPTAPYFTLLLASDVLADECVEAGRVPFPNSSMQRDVAYARFCYDNDVDLLVMTSHLESLSENVRKRQEQMEIGLSFCRSASHVLWLGDFNWYPKPDGLLDLSSAGFVDVCCSIPHLDDPSTNNYADCTWNPTRNGLIATQRFKPTRLDRIFVKSPEAQRPCYIHNWELIGTDAWCDPEQGEPVWPSDHFGLFAQLGWGNSTGHPSSMDICP